ncbi:probable aquaporin TIP5-1 [Macadamia integrifolia]|uniref:probable aquaporin TIP5-1 n=1 Tax=Macadamia integrifolia TaxID=60698 RepID=UPI001C4E525B|nr:probable aquaporin TIP5-1 [Macadamia integrifolia]
MLEEEEEREEGEEVKKLPEMGFSKGVTTSWILASLLAALLYLSPTVGNEEKPLQKVTVIQMNRIINTLKHISSSISANLMAASTPLWACCEHSITMAALRSYLAEFISSFLFVFASVGSTMSALRLTPDATSNPSSLVAIALANAFALLSAVYISVNISGGHVNPAVTFGMAVGGHISIPTAMFYWVAQILGSVMACLLLRVVTVTQGVHAHEIAVEMTGFGAAVLECVMTFTLVYTVYAAGDQRRGSFAVIGPVMIGLIVGANILAAGPFTGGSMNPALSLGTALISGNFKNQAVYWVGPLIGAAAAALLYENVIFPPQPTDSSRGLGLEGVGV